MDRGRLGVAVAGLALVLGCLLNAAVAHADEPRITVKRFRVAGNTILTPDEVRSALNDYTGKSLTLKQIKAAARKLRLALEAKGYMMARAFVPPQEFRDDAVEITVQEGQVGKVTIEGNQHYSRTFIERFFAPATGGGPLNRLSLQRALLVLNQNMDLRVQSVLDARKDGVVDVTLKVRDERPLHYIADYDNFGVRLVGRNRAGAGILAGNVLLEGDQLGVKVTHPFNVDQADPFYFLTYGAPVGDRGNRVEASYANAHTFVGDELAQLGIEGDASIATLRGTVMDDVRLDAISSWFAELTVKDVDNTALDGGLVISRDRVRSLAGGHRGTNYTGQGKTQVAHVAQVIAGLGTLFGGSDETDTTSRQRADNSYARATAEVVAIHRVSAQGFLLGRFAGQAASDALMVPEQFALGGPDSVRGYQQGEFLGDYGYALAGEYRHSVLERRQSSIQMLAFLDHGSAHLKKPLGGEAAGRDLTGAGVGVRGQFGRTVSVRADWGRALDPDRNVDGDRSKLHAQVACRF